MLDAAIILAAGKGTRMASDRPKVLHSIEGRPMLSYVIDAIRPACGERIYVVVGYRAVEVIEACEGDTASSVHFVRQEEQLGTGHAVLQCEEAMRDFAGTVIVLNGDVPCLRSKTIEAFRHYHAAEAAAATVLSARVSDPAGYGRIVRDKDGSLLRIVEEKDADEATKRIDEINSGLFCFDKVRLFDSLKSMGRDNAQDEYYLTDAIEILRSCGEPVRVFCVADAHEVTGVNTEAELEVVRGYIKGPSS